jgi:hypothetical protein
MTTLAIGRDKPFAYLLQSPGSTLLRFTKVRNQPDRCYFKFGDAEEPDVRSAYRTHNPDFAQYGTFEKDPYLPNVGTVLKLAIIRAIELARNGRNNFTEGVLRIGTTEWFGATPPNRVWALTAAYHGPVHPVTDADVLQDLIDDVLRVLNDGNAVVPPVDLGDILAQGVPIDEVAVEGGWT